MGCSLYDNSHPEADERERLQTVNINNIHSISSKGEKQPVQESGFVVNPPAKDPGLFLVLLLQVFVRSVALRFPI